MTHVARADWAEIPKTAAGLGDGGDENDGSDTGSTASEENDGEQAENVNRIVEQAKASPSLRKTLSRKDRNHTFDKVLVDTRYRGKPRLICRSCDVISTYDIVTKGIFIVAVDFQKPYNCDREFKEWPAVDQEGSYKDMIDATRYQMKQVMAKVRNLI